MEKIRSVIKHRQTSKHTAEATKSNLDFCINHSCCQSSQFTDGPDRQVRWTLSFYDHVTSLCRCHIWKEVHFRHFLISWLTVLTRLPVICHHRIRLRFIKGHSSDDHSVRSSPRGRRNLFVNHNFGSHLRFGLNDLSRAIFLWGGWFFPNKLPLILFLLVIRRIHKSLYVMKT